ncbi:SDR family NAD(P)-dependent oxidoreductase [Streptomyces sp. NBC_01716]|uniref:SDR family NAD(P)-dependent oxidoreductase n=1 Tax=Streptomyces sp. NBC_01716 TaxID=2975917 RepID=UPI002E2F9C79|nr:glucose 1-dehydrogenase [Streptomyces sp. NBC_01716]
MVPSPPEGGPPRAGAAPPGPLSGKVAVVTGGGSGIGAASARRLSHDGARVVVVDRDAAGAEKVARELPGEAVAVTADVSEEAGVERYVRVAVERFGGIDLHHLNAGVVGSLEPLPDLSADDFDQVIAVNLRGPFLGLRAAFRRYREQGTGGSVVITGSIAGLRGSDDLLPYQASKYGVRGLVEGGAVYGAPRGVRVNSVAPGLVPSGLFAAASGPGAGGDMERRARTTPMRRVGTPEEIAAVVAFLLGDEAAFVTGTTVSADGGAGVVNTVRPSGGAGAWTPAAPR